MMNDRVALQKTNKGWDFINEWQLEDFVWNNMQEIFELDPLARQFSIKGEICDILAIRKNGQLVIIELKNVEDRYVINQLTRYYDNLLEEKPFQDKVDYHQEILLFAICPSFHRHNFIDQKHSQLKFSLFCFSIFDKSDEFYFSLSQINEDSEIKTIKINYTEPKYQNQTNENIPEPPKILLTWLNGLTPKELENIRAIRYKILSFDKRIEEIVISRSIIYASSYGKNKMRNCAEFRFDQRAKKILFFLWLAIPNRKNKTIVRMQIDTLYEYSAYWRKIPLKDGTLSQKKLDNMILGHSYYSFEDNIYTNGIFGHSMLKYMTVSSSIESLSADYTGNIINEALQTWLERFSR